MIICTRLQPDGIGGCYSHSISIAPSSGKTNVYFNVTQSSHLTGAIKISGNAVDTNKICSIGTMNAFAEYNINI